MRPSAPRPYQNIILALLAVGLLMLALGGYLSPITRSVLSPVLDIQTWLTDRFQAVQDVVNAPSDIARLRQRNAELEAELARLQTEIIGLQQQVSENQIFAALLDFARAQPNNEYLAAEVVGRDPSPFVKYVFINRGSDDGVRAGMPVVTDQGLIGRVAAVTANAARVQLITDPASSVNIKIQPSDVDAELLGSLTGELSLDLIPQDAEVQAGNLVLTSGLGGNYPSGILIGQINSVRKEATALFQTASVQPIVDFTRIKIVLIIVNFNPIDIAPLIPESTPSP